MKSAGRIFIAAFFFLLCSLTVASPHPHSFFVDPNVRITWIDVKTSTLEEADQELKIRGPKDLWGFPRYAVTSWRVRWSWPIDMGRACYDRTTAEAQIEMQLPRWVPTIPPSPQDQHRWVNAYRALLIHEYDHAAQARLTAKLIERAIKRAAKHRTLTAKDAHIIARRLISQNNEWDASYDKRTQHGRDQGVNLIETPIYSTKL